MYFTFLLLGEGAAQLSQTLTVLSNKAQRILI